MQRLYGEQKIARRKVNMQPYGKKKRGSGKMHSHDKCSVCAENNFNKKTARQDSKREAELFEIEQQLDIPFHLRYYNREN